LIGPDGGERGRISVMDNNLYALETLVGIRLTEARAEARRLDLLALASPPRRPVRRRLGLVLIALGEWLRDTGAVVPARFTVQ
jgi:hypothetical protein